MKDRKLDGKSYNAQVELLELLKSQAPHIFSEGKVNSEKLKAALGEALESDTEHYGLNWAGKSDCFGHILESTAATLKPQRSESLDFDNTENIFIEGDNLEVLKVLQRSYYGKIKMIYIDPPYNTGNDSFIYPDRFKEEKEDYELRAGIKDAEGLLTKDGFWRKNSKDAGHFHSNWLSMMYPRLFHAKNLLREDGVIFVSIDDNEVHNLRMIMNEIFGEENFIDCIVWKKRYGGGAKEKYLVTMHEYVLTYAKELDNIKEIFVPLTEESIERYYKNKDSHYEQKGAYRTHPLESMKSFGERKNLIFPIKAPDGTEIMPKRQWRWSLERVTKAIRNDELEFSQDKKGNWTLHTKQYLKDENGIRQTKFFSVIEDIYTQHGTNEIIDIFGNAQVFGFPKPSRLIGKLTELITEPDNNDIVIDFFAGSCATAQAVMTLNAKDGGNRKFIMVQLAEDCDEDSDAYKAGYKHIADIGKERIRRAAKKIKDDNKGKLDFDGKKLDLGFKVFRLEDSNFKQWRENIKEPLEFKKHLMEMVDNVKKDAASEDMLFEIILKNSRFDLNVAAEKKVFDSVEYYVLASENLATESTEHTENDNISKDKNLRALRDLRGEDIEIVCLADKITKKFIDKVLKDRPQKFTCLDMAFKNDDQLKTNTALQMDSAKIEFKVI